MFEKILYPTDFSDIAGKALRYVVQLKEAGAKEVIVLHVIDQRSIDTLDEMLTKDTVALEKSLEEESIKKTSGLENELKGKGFNVKIRIEKGVPFNEILKTANEENVSAIVIGSHGKSNIAEMLLGSVSEKVVRKAMQPVLLVKR
jgi:nucleotide-binding universal stress UspA family protein